LVDVLLGHHAGDQAETILMRRRRGSAARGLAGMAALSEGTMVRRVRPLLSVRPERLRATLQAAGLGWVDDPTNHDQSYTRVRLRSEIGGALDALLAEAARHGAARTESDKVLARVLASRAAFFPEGYAVLTPGPIEPQALALLLRMISGQAFAPPPAAVAKLARTLRPATLGGVQILPAGRLGPGWLLVREAAAMAPPAPIQPNGVWDGRVRVAGGSMRPSETLGALGAEAAGFRQSGLPSAVLRTLPAVRRDGVLSAVQLPPYIAEYGNRPEIILRHDVSPACGAPFVA
jgi:tRNA(Ile)-lysidine synthase